jgi:hypothetical protein
MDRINRTWTPYKPYKQYTLFTTLLIWANKESIESLAHTRLLDTSSFTPPKGSYSYDRPSALPLRASTVCKFKHLWPILGSLGEFSRNWQRERTLNSALTAVLMILAKFGIFLICVLGVISLKMQIVLAIEQVYRNFADFWIQPVLKLTALHNRAFTWQWDNFFRWQNPHQSRNMSLLWNLWLGMATLFLDLGSD